MKQGRLEWRVVLTFALAGVVGCSDDAGNEEQSSAARQELDEALEDVIDHTIIVDVQAFADGAKELDESVVEFCEAPAEASLLELQDDWLALTRTWNRAGIYDIGPLDDDFITPSIIWIESMRQRGTDYTDTVIDTLDAALASDAPLDEAYFSSLTFNRVGMLALEVLLFEERSTEPAATDAATIAQSFADSPRKCSYLQGISKQVSDRAQGVEAGWTEEFLGGPAFRDELLEGLLADGSESVPALIVSVIAHIEYLRVRKLDGILDMATVSRARPEPSPFYSNLASGLDGFEAFLSAPDADATFFGVMTDRGFGEEVEVIRGNLESARSAVADNDREAASAAFLELETSFRRELPQGLGVELGLSFSDGD